MNGHTGSSPGPRAGGRGSHAAGWATLADSLRFLGLAFVPGYGHVTSLYEGLSDSSGLGRTTLYLNLGYWRDDPPDIDAAGEAMADLLARTAGLRASDDVLDCGFGLADQDMLWLERYGPRAIHGVNVSEPQVLRAQRRVLERGMHDRITLAVGDAARMAVRSAAVDVVFSLESAFHFRTREDFFREAWRALRPGGRMVVADQIGVACRATPWEWLLRTLGLSFCQMPCENLYPLEEYRRRLERAGFVEIDVRSIWQDVYPPYARWAREALRRPEVARRLNPVLRLFYLVGLSAGRTHGPRVMDYCLASAKKPGPPSRR